MENFYVAWLHNTETESMAVRVLPRLSQDGDIKRVRQDFPAMGLTRVSSSRQVHQKVAQMPQGALALGNRRTR